MIHHRLLARLVVGLVLIAGPALAQTPTKSRLTVIQESGTLRVGTTGDFNPMSFRDPATQEYRGHQIDLAHKLAQDMNVKVAFVPTDWKTLINGVVANQYDIVMTGASMSVPRAMAAGFTRPWGRNAFVPLVLKDRAGRYKDWDDLNNPAVTVGFNLGTTMETFANQELPKAKLRKVESPARDWQELLAERVDVTITSLIEAASLTREYPQLTTLFLDKPRNGIPMSFIVPIDDIVWLNFVNNWLAIRQQSGFIDEVNRKWRIVGQ
ncbi:MAG: transporter substrate-binding domain-containing protein [Proteobacteria bacterium]|nr:transporter substrate-binding domain-containing protein [Pseudomonadota bacterium]